MTDQMAEELNTAATEADHKATPKGWEPYAEEAGMVGEAIVRLPRPNATERDLLITAGFDPDSWKINGPVNTRRWMRYDQEWLYYYKFDVVQGESVEVRQEHIDDLVKHIRRRRGTSPLNTYAGDDAFVYLASDWQIGKREGEIGTPETIERVCDSITQAVARVKQLRRAGHQMPVGVFAGLGDLLEGTCGFYPGQQFLIDRNRREQNRVVRELITYAILQLAPLFERFVVATVGGNHGENREEGKRVTSDGDNDDVSQFEAVRESFDMAGNFPHLEWVIPGDELSIALDVQGVRIGLTHGHLFRKGSTVQAKAHEWWKGQDFGFQAVRDTRILCSAHFHHYSNVTYGPRTHIQTPAMDPGSKWHTDGTGEDAPPGVVTFRVDPTRRLGYDDLKILEPTA